MIQPNNICAIFVAYFPGATLADSVQNVLASGVGAVVIVDNTPNDCSTAIFNGLQSRECVHVIRNGCNKGMAQALNQGADLAKSLNYEWILTFDQDSRICDTLVLELLAGININPRPETVAVVGANYLDCKNGMLGQKVADNARFQMAKYVITSGSLISLSALQEVGGFETRLFIDMVDVEICFRLRRAGYQVLITERPLMKHAIGNLEPKKVLFFKFFVTNHNPRRRYYIFRNTILMLKSYFWFDPLWGFRMVFGYLPKVFIKACVFETRRKENLQWIIRGSIDGLLARLHRKVL
jgi:rhamnosyltransferase